MTEIKYAELVEILAVFISKNSNSEKRQAAYLLLCHYIGKKAVKEIIEEVAEVKDRGDYRVIKWGKEVRKRYKHKCAKCGSNEKTHAHHISSWSRDPMGRIDINNGILLCVNCHSLEHPEIKNLIKSVGGKSAK